MHMRRSPRHTLLMAVQGSAQVEILPSSARTGAQCGLLPAEGAVILSQVALNFSMVLRTIFECVCFCVIEYSNERGLVSSVAVS